MNWWRINVARIAVILGISLIGCKEEDLIVLDGTNRPFDILSETFSLPVSMAYFDSLRTDEEGILLAGSYTDTDLGTVTAKTFTEIIYRDGLPLLDDELDNDSTILTSTLRFDSVTVKLRVKEVITDMSNPGLGLRFYELADTILAQGFYLADREIPLGDQIGEDTDLMSMAELDSDTVPVYLEFRLDDAYGQKLFNRFAKKDFNGTDDTSVDSLFNGLQLPGLNFESISGDGLYKFDLTDDSTGIYIHAGYEEAVLDTATTSFSFRFNTVRHFSNVSRDRTGTAIETVADKDEVAEIAGISHFAPIFGIQPKLDISDVVTFLTTLQDNDIIERAILTVNVDDPEVENVPSSRFYYASTDLGKVDVNWGDLTFDPRNSIILEDLAYFGQPRPLTSDIDSATYASSISLFVQLLKDELAEGTILTEEILMVSPVPTSLGRTKLNSDAVELKVFYTKSK